MDTFSFYFLLGLEHISDVNGYDHILFLAALCLQFRLNQWKPLLGLITAFTLGHLITLALSTTGFIQFPSAVTELLIALSIFFTALYNVFVARRSPKHAQLIDFALSPFLYGITLFFGLIHGLGFSTQLRSLLGKTRDIGYELFAFHTGLELGQLAIVAILLFGSAIFVQVIKIPQRSFVLFVSGVIAALCLPMIWERIQTLQN